MKKFVLSIALLFSLSTFAGHLQQLIYIRSFTPVQMDSVLTANSIPTGLVPISYGIDVYKVLYNTVNPDSTATIASGLMAVPKSTSCKFPILMYAHGTMTRKSDAPSSLRGSEAVIGLTFAAMGYVTVLPDYLGLGDGPGLHPYQHAHSEATAVVDMIRSAKEARDSIGFRLNDKLFLTGYSQGGHACVASHKLIQEQLASEMTVTAAAPMSGAYDMSGTMVDVMSSDSVYPEPSYLPYLVFSWQPIYHFYNSDTEIIANPYDTLLPPLFNGNYNNSYINHRAPNVPKHLFKPEVFDSFLVNQNHFFRVALRENDVYNWKPNCPVRVYFCRKDSYVPCKNAAVLYQHFMANGCTQCDTLDVDPHLDHTACAQNAIFLMKFYFDAFTSVDSCALSGISELPSSVSVNYFNQLQTLRIEGAALGSWISISDISGRMLSQKRVDENLEEIPAEGWAQGVYIVSVTDKNNAIVSKKFFRN
ncbi:MAG: lipase family protein [Chitinophagales bacterium]